MKKLTQEELEKIKELQSKFQNSMTELGAMEYDFNELHKAIKQLSEKKEELISYISVLREKEMEFSKELSEKYGQGIIDINTGEINEK